MKRSELYFAGLQIPLDLCMILLAATGAYFLRDLPFLKGYVSPVFAFEYIAYMKAVLLLVPFVLLVFAFEGMYALRVTRSFGREVRQVFRGTVLALVVLIVTIFLNREWFSSRFVIVVGWGLTFVFVLVGRMVLQKIQKHLVATRGIGRHRMLLLGKNEKVDFFREVLSVRKELGYEVVGRMTTLNMERIKQLKQKKGIDEVLVGDPAFTDEDLEELLKYCQINNIAYQYLPSTFQANRMHMHMFLGEPVIEFLHTPLDGWGKILKRIFDLLAGTVLMIFFLPIIAVIALLIKLEDPDGPVVYKNRRVGENGEEFFVYKFRYMLWRYCITKENPDFKQAVAYEQELIAKHNVRSGGVLYKIQDDPRRMKVGRVIEKYSLDELPQFFNVLEGTMSLVGPRPHQKREVERYQEYHRRLLTVKPGVTGLAQVSGRSDLSFEDEYRLDLFYIENWSLWKDIDICFRTAGALLKRRKNNK